MSDNVVNGVCGLRHRAAIEGGKSLSQDCTECSFTRVKFHEPRHWKKAVRYHLTQSCHPSAIELELGVARGQCFEHGINAP